MKTPYQPTPKDARSAATSIHESRIKIESLLSNVAYGTAMKIIFELNEIEEAAYEVTREELIGLCAECREGVFENDTQTFECELLCENCSSGGQT